MGTILGVGMHERIVGVSVDLADRYGTRRGRRPLLLAAVAAVVLVFLTWLGWAAWLSASPEVRSGMQSWEVIDQHSTTIVAKVEIDEGVDDPLCRVQARADDHSVVGELQFTPVNGRNEETIATERKAVSVDWIGCTSKDQRRAK